MRRRRSSRERIKDVISDRLANIGPTATAIERLAAKAEAIVDAFVEAGEFAISLRRRGDGDTGSSSRLEQIIDRILDNLEAVVEIPFEFEDED